MPKFLPTEEQIAEWSAAIRLKWDRRVEHSRKVVHNPRPEWHPMPARDLGVTDEYETPL